MEDNRAFGRQSVAFQPTVWGDYFITPPAAAHDHGLLPVASDPKLELRSAEELRKSVKRMLGEMTNNDINVLEKMKLVDSLQRLGLDYHFKEEISNALRCIHSHKNDLDYNDLYAVSLHFRLLRQHGYNVPSDVFKKFKDKEQGDLFDETLSSDAKGLFSLYEASFLATRDDHILDEAMAFARAHLESMMPSMEEACPALAAQTKLALVTPCFRGIRRLEARHYIPIYAQEKDHNPDLLELARIDFNMLQLVHRAELARFSKWWKDLGFATKFSFARDRVAECYFWGAGVHFEPQQAQVRMIVAKMALFLTIVDDMFDVFSTIEELQKLTHAFQLWEFDDVDELPEYMQVLLHAFGSFIQEIEESMPRDEWHTRMHFLKKVIKEMIVSYHDEAKWANEGYMPTFDEYLDVAMISFGYPMSICESIVCSGEKVSKEGLDWITSMPKIVQASTLIGRLMDDMANKLEKERCHVATSVQCYMTTYGVSEEDARAKLQEQIENAWKDLNEECLKPQPLELWPQLAWAIEYARVTEVIYKHGDSFSQPIGHMKDNIKLLFAEPIPAESVHHGNKFWE